MSLRHYAAMLCHIAQHDRGAQWNIHEKFSTPPSPNRGCTAIGYDRVVISVEVAHAKVLTKVGSIDCLVLPRNKLIHMQPVEQVDSYAFERPEFQQRMNDFARVYLAEGDSWFSFGSTRYKNVLGSLSLPVPACVLNIAEPGDTLRRMHETTRNRQFYFYLRNKSGRRWDAILLSGGGNDLIDAIWNDRTQQSEILIKPSAPGSIDQTNLSSVINRDALDALLNYIKINVAQIVAEGRDQVGGDSNDVPLLMHTYSLIQPRNSPVRFIGGGPWLYPACVWLGIDPALWLDLSRLLLEELAACLKSINLPNFHVVDTLSLTTTLIPAAPGTTGDSNDFENEIHPNRRGYDKLAETWSAALAQLA